MSSGHVLSGVVPTEEEYERVEYDEVKELLQFIFNFVTPVPSWNFFGKVRELTSMKMIKKVIITYCSYRV